MEKYDLAGNIVSLGLTVEMSIYVNDNEHIRRTWKERLFTKPWKPLQRWKWVFKPKAHVIEWDGTTRAIVSPQTYDALLKSGYKDTSALAAKATQD